MFRSTSTAVPGRLGVLGCPRAGWVLLLALVVRVLWALIVPVEPLSDSNAYDISAQNIAAGHGYSLDPTPEVTLAAGKEVAPSAYWAVGTPAVVALLYTIFGHTYVPVVVLNILIALAGIAVTMRLTSEWLSPQHGTVAGLLLALWPGQFGFVTAIASELWFNLGVLLTLLVWTRWSWAWWSRALLSGVLLAATCYVRPVAMLLPIVLVMVTWFDGWLKWREPAEAGSAADTERRATGWWRPVVAALAASAVMFGLLSPWTLRNARVMGAPALVSMNAGANMWMGNHPGTNGQYALLPPETDGMSELDRDVYLKKAAKDYIRAEPVAFVTRTLRKIVTLHASEAIFVYWNVTAIERLFGPQAVTGLKVVGTGYWLLVLGSSLVGVVVLMRRSGFWRVWLHPAWVFWGYFTAVHAVIVVQDRYHYPNVPFIAAFASVPVLALAQWLIARRHAHEAVEPGRSLSDGN